MAETANMTAAENMTGKPNAPVGKDESLTTGEVISYGMGGLTSTMGANIKSGFHMAFLTEYAGLDSAVVGSFNMVLTIWDAINDPLIGGLADRTNTKWGKYRPHMMMGCILWAITTIMMFSIPNLGLQGKYIYYIGLLFVWSVFYTQFTVPWQSLNTVMSSDPSKRDTLLRVRQVCGALAGTALSMAFMPVVRMVDGGAGGYTTMAVIVGVILVVTGLAAANGAKKKDYQGSLPTPPKKGFKFQMKTIITNKAVICAAILLGCCSLMNAMSTATSIYYLTYVLGNRSLMTIAALMSMVVSVPTMMFMPKIIKAIGKKGALIAGGAICLVSPVVLSIVRENVNANIYYINNVFATLGYCMINFTCMSLIPDCTDYTELHYGTSQAGVINSSVTFMKKFMTSFSTMIVGFALKAAGYAGSKTVATPELINSIINVKVAVPVIMIILIFIVTKIYPITREYGIEMRAQLKEIRAAKKA